MFACVYVIFFFISIVFGGDENEAKIRYYHESFEDFTELPLHKATEILSTPWYNSNRTTIIFCHGFTGHPKGPAVTAIIKAYLEQGLSNVALLNWERLAAPIYNAVSTSYLHWAVPNSIQLSFDFANTLLKLSDGGMNLNKTHLLGHSLGAHIMGMAGNHMIKHGVLLPWITGLDPAGFIFDSKHPRDRLSPFSALFVDVIHSDPNKYGSKRSLGTVDFWPNYRNGIVQQPGCKFRPGASFTLDDRGDGKGVLGDLCNHNRCWEYLLDTMKYPGKIIGSHAKNFRVWKNYSKEQSLATVLEIGKFEPNAVSGDYYFVTTDVSPFGLGKKGLSP